MLVTIPLGVEGLTLRRIPYASIGLVAAMALMFVWTWLLPDGGEADQRLEEAYGFWIERQHLELPEDFRSRLFTPAMETEYAAMQATARRDLRATPEARDQWAQDQETLDALSRIALEAVNSGPFQALALVPARGLKQVGWITHMFMHGGWLHLIGNLLFFYVVALLLEDIWGRWLFPMFFVVGGLIAAVAQYLIDPQSPIPNVGASGAVAACMGAFAIRFALARIRMGYFLWLFVVRLRGTFVMPAWILGLLWFALEVWHFLEDRGAEAGVAVMAHIGGFMFGSVFALGMKASRLEETYFAHAVEKEFVAYERDPAVDAADRLRESGALDEARAQYLAILRKKPDNVDAQLGMVRLDLQAGQKRVAMDRVATLFRKRLQDGQPEKLWPLVEELHDVYAPELLPPSLAKRVADEMQHAPEGLHFMAERLYAAAGNAAGGPGAAALCRAAQVAQSNQRPATVVLDYVTRARAKGTLEPELQQRLDALDQRARVHDGRSAMIAESARDYGGALDLDVAGEAVQGPPPPPPVFSPRQRPHGPLGTPKLHPCQLAGVSGAGLKLVSSAGAGTRTLSFGEVLAVAVGVAGVPQPDAPAPKQVLYTDFITSWGDGTSGPKVLRVPGHALGLSKLYPALPMKEAYGEFLKFLLERTGAHALPDREALTKGQYPRFTDVPQLNAAIYERA